MKPIRIAIIGYGKIAARPACALDPGQSALRAGRDIEPLGPGRRADLHRLARADPQRRGAEAVAITTPPEPRYEIARECVARRPPLPARKAADGRPRGDRRRSTASPRRRAVTLFTTWHAQHNPAVDAAAKALAGKRIKSLEIHWHEDVHKWHPGQQWIWEPGGFGVFDPGINALSIATKIFPGDAVRPVGGASGSRERADADRRRYRLLEPRRPTGRSTPASTGAAARARNGRSRSRRATGQLCASKTAARS